MHLSHQVIDMMCAMFGDCLLSSLLAKFLCSFGTEIDIPTLKYLERYTGLNSIFYCINATTVQLLLDLWVKIWWLFAQLYKNPNDYFVLEVSTVSRFQN